MHTRDDKEQELKFKSSIQIDKLKKINIKLREKIKELNQTVEKAIDRANSRRVNVKKSKDEHQDQDHLLQSKYSIKIKLAVRDREIRNAQHQIESNNIEIRQLQDKIDNMSGVDKVLSLEASLKDMRMIKEGLDKKIRLQERKNVDQGKSLDKLSNENEYSQKIHSMVEELRVWKEKVRKIERNTEKEKQTRMNQVAKIQQVELENQKYKSELDHIIQKKKINEPGPLVDENVIVKEKEDLEKVQKDEAMQQKKEVREQEKRIAELSFKVEEMRRQLKEKEALQRLSTNKINELKRKIKQQQLKPIEHVFGQSQEKPLASKALSKQNLQEHNQNLKITNETPFRQFEEEDHISDDAEKDIEKRIKEKADVDLDKNQVIPKDLGKAGENKIEKGKEGKGKP